jgi:hypothetical protein
MWEKRIEIRWRDLDGSRHVNNAVYLSYLEEARSEWLGHVLGGREPVWDFVLARVAIDYRRELGLDDGTAVVSCRLARIGRDPNGGRRGRRTGGGRARGLEPAGGRVAAAHRPGTGGLRVSRRRGRARRVAA